MKVIPLDWISHPHSLRYPELLFSCLRLLMAFWSPVHPFDIKKHSALSIHIVKFFISPKKCAFRARTSWGASSPIRDLAGQNRRYEVAPGTLCTALNVQPTTQA